MPFSKSSQRSTKILAVATYSDTPIKSQMLKENSCINWQHWPSFVNSVVVFLSKSFSSYFRGLLATNSLVNCAIKEEPSADTFFYSKCLNNVQNLVWYEAVVCLSCSIELSVVIIVVFFLGNTCAGSNAEGTLIHYWNMRRPKRYLCTFERWCPAIAPSKKFSYLLEALKI